METMLLNGCSHYKRNCELLAPCCNTFHPCRKCHDEANAGCYSTMDRYAVNVMRCLFCKTVQPISNECICCRKEMASYYCGICHFFVDNDKNQYMWHCAACGYCRSIDAGEEKYTHCLECNICMPPAHTEHINTDSNCPVCMEKMGSGYDNAVKPGPCSHTLHEKCYNDCLSHRKYKCPVCSKTFATVDMSPIWAIYDRDIAMNPMPDDFKDEKATFLCNDCGIREVAPLNIIGYKCPQCKGYNTVTV